MKVYFAIPLLFSGILRAGSSGTFHETATMSIPRLCHTATLMRDGTVLISGGYRLTPAPGAATRFGGATETAECYKPDSGTFVLTGTMTSMRYGHSATLLPDGKVLIAGGASGEVVNGSKSNLLPSAELYDPSHGTFTSTGSMMAGRAWHTATLLNNGKVLLAGGDDGDYHYFPFWRNTSTAELYDPPTGTFSRTGDMTLPLAGPIATLLNNGKVWITTGEDGPDFSAQLYDPEAGTFNDTGWRDTTSLIAATVNLLKDGQLLITLNVSECDFNSRKAGLHDVSTGVFREIGQMAYSICRPTGVTLSDGSVLITGGLFTIGGPAQLYDPSSGLFSRTGDMSAGRTHHTATLLANGDVLVAGGCTAACLTDTAASAEIYTPVVPKPAPKLLTAAGDRPEQGAILHAGTSELASASHPAKAGDVLEIYLTGLLNESVIPPQAIIGGRAAEVLYFGNAGGSPTLNQVNLRLPDGVNSGSAVPVWMAYLGRPSNTVTIAIQ